MDTVQINKILSRNPLTQKQYLGCFPADQIPAGTQKMHFPHCMVVNVDSADQAGSHWIALFCESAHIADYYDSAGVWPPLSPHIRNFLFRNYATIHYNTHPLQSERARTCGKHVIFFVYHRCAGASLDKILKFMRSKRSPDTVVHEFMRKRIFDNQTI